MNPLNLFLPCAAGVESWLALEVQRITGLTPTVARGGVELLGNWRDALQLNLHSRLAMRVLICLLQAPYRTEQDVYEAALSIPWELWFTPRERFKVEVTARHSPLTSLNFAALRVKDGVADRFRSKGGVRPDVDTRQPDMRVQLHLSQEQMFFYLDSSGEPLFKRGWREDKGEAPLKETLAAAMLYASGWAETPDSVPLYDPCCGSGTILIEAAQMVCHIAPGAQRHFAFEKMLPYQARVWSDLKQQALAAQRRSVAGPGLFGSDVAHRMVDFAGRNAARAGVAGLLELRGGDALQRLPPCAPGVMMLNPPYGERIAVAGVAGRSAEPVQTERVGHELAQSDDGGDFFARLASHWKAHYTGWSAWLLTPDLKLPGRMHLRESRRVPLYNGPIECRLFRFDIIKGSPEKARGGALGNRKTQ